MMLSLMMGIAALMPLLKHPMSMGLALIIETLIIAMASGLYSMSFMYSYILMIIMLSGVLVLFTYMSSVASNKKFSPSIAMLVYLVSIVVVVTMIMNKNVNIMLDSYINAPEVSMTKLFNHKIKYTTIMMMIYLLFTMIVVVNIINIQEGPLRKKV